MNGLLPGELKFKENTERDRFTVESMLVNQNAIFLPGHSVSSMKAI